VILQLGWSYPADMWSMGCILVELLTGQVLFGMGQSQSENALAHLAAMHQILGPFP
jgi:dual-specificity kinase